MLGRVALLLLVCSSVRAQDLVLTKDPKQDTYTISGTKATPKGLQLACILKNASEAEVKKIQWFRSSKGFADVELTKIKIEKENGSSILQLSETEARDGVTKCRYGQQVHAWTVYPHFKMEHLPMSETVIEGDDLKIKCKLRANAEKDGTLTWTWSKLPEDEFDKKSYHNNSAAIDTWNWIEVKNSTMTGEELEVHIKIVSGDNFSVLKIEDAVKTDRFYYRCYATMDLRTKEREPIHASEHTLVRIKDRYSALYPFIGIVVEVIALALVIFLCERRKSSQEGDDDDDDEEPEAEATGNGNSNLRHRRT